VEPGAVFAHLLALRCRRVAFAGRSLVALRRRAPTQLDAVVGVVRHVEIDRTVDQAIDPDAMSLRHSLMFYFHASVKWLTRHF